MGTPVQILTAAHPWLSERKAMWLTQTRYHNFQDSLGLEGEALFAAMDSAVHIYSNMEETQLKDTIARIEEEYLDPIQYEFNNLRPTSTEG